MTFVLPTVLALWLGQLPSSRAVLTADEVQEHRERHLAVAKGHAQLRLGTLRLNADEIDYDHETGRFEVPGQLFGLDRTVLILASRAEGRVGANEELTLEHVHLEQFRWLPPDLVERARTAGEVRAAGKLLMAVDGERLRRLGPSHYALDGVRLSPCACGEVEKCRADWALAAPYADVHTGEYALLRAPELRLWDVPIPLLRPPDLYVPLAQRRSGFLLPHLNYQSQNGFLIDEPFYWVLGPSYDATLYAGVITGEPETQLGPGGVVSSGPGAGGVAGPRASVELRYAPTDGTVGRLFVTLLDDFNHDADPAGGAPLQRGTRATLRELQIQDFDPRNGDRVDLNFVSDARLTGQLTTDLLYAQIPATRSQAFAFHRDDDWLVTVSGVVLQDFQGDFSPSNAHGLLLGAGSPNTVERLPSLSLDVPDRALGGTPLHFGMSASAARIGTLGAAYDNLALSAAGPGSAPGVSVAEARAAVEQLDALPTVSVLLPATRFATGGLRLGWRQDAWLFETSPLPPHLETAGPPLSQAGARGYPLLDADVETSLARDFGSGADRIQHSISPGVELRSIPFQLMAGTVPPLWATPVGGQVFDRSSGLLIASALPLPYDEVALAPGLTSPATSMPGTLARSTTPGGVTQAVVRVDQRLRTRDGELARLEIGEDVDGAGLEATYALARLQLGPVHASGFFDWSNQELPCPDCTPTNRSLRRLTEAFADAGATDPRGDTVGITFVRAIAAGAPRLAAPLDLLFAERLASDDPRWSLPDISQVALTGLAKLWRFTVHGAVTYQFSAGSISQVLVGAGYVSPLHCCGIDVNAVFQPSVPGQLGFAALLATVDLGELAGTVSH